MPLQSIPSHRGRHRRGLLPLLVRVALASAIIATITAMLSQPLMATEDHTQSALAPLPSVVSTNLCADLLLLRLAAPEQILSVSYQAQDPAQSPMAPLANHYPANRGTVEELLYFKPQIALTYLGWSGRPHAELLAQQGIELVPIPYPREIEDALSMTLTIAHEIGRDSAGQQQVSQARARVNSLAERAASYRASQTSPAPGALYLRPNGGTAGSETYVDAMLQLIGLRNLAAENGIRGWGSLPLEQLVADPPDLFLLGYFDQSQPQSKSRYGRHPLLRRLLKQVPSIQMPSSSAWGCGGLELIDAAEFIADRLATIERELEP